MLAVQFGDLIRQTRRQKALGQAALAGAAKVSRTILSRLEQGKPRPVQTDVLDRVLAALDVVPQVSADDGMAERRLARLEQDVRIERQRNRHLRLALELTGDLREARRRIARAKAVVELWRRNRSCSPFYIRRWSALLALPPGELARAMAGLGEWEDALFQNTPWSWAWN